ncbi:hypothetical protein ACOMHN_028317 [Nucella lapillus]
MDKVPPELLYYIFSKLDGHSLGQASGVNHQWRSVATNLGQAFNIWFRLCLKEIGLDRVIAQTGLTWLSTEAGKVRGQSQLACWEFWRRLFAANHCCRRVGMEGSEVEVTPLFGGGVPEQDEDVVALDIHPCSHLYGTGEFVAGCRTGDLFHCSAVSISSPDSSVLPCNLAWHISPPSSVATLTMGGCPGYDPGVRKAAVSATIVGDVIFSDTDLKQSQLIYGLGKQVMCISSLGEYFVVGNNDSVIGGLLVYRATEEPCSFWDPSCIRRRRRQTNSLHLPRSSVSNIHPEEVLRLWGSLFCGTQAVALAYNEVVGGDKRGNLCSWRFPPLRGFDTGGMGKVSRGKGKKKEGPKIMAAPSNHMRLGTSIVQLVFHQDFLLALTKINTGSEAAVLVIPRKDWKVVQIIQGSILRNLALHSIGCVARMAVCAHILAVGFTSGEVVVLDTSAKDWTKHLPRSVVSRFHCPISKLTTMNFTLGPRGPALLIGGQSIFVCQWPKRAEGRAEVAQHVATENSTDGKELKPVVKKKVFEGKF